MMELGHNVGGGCWKGREEEIAKREEAVGRVTCCSDKDLERAWADVHAWAFLNEVVASGAGVGYCGILLWNWRVWGGDTRRGRQTRFISKYKI